MQLAINILLFLLFLLFSNLALTQELDKKQMYETYFRDKIKGAFPDTRLVVDVTLKQTKDVSIGLFPYRTKNPDDHLFSIDKVKQLLIYSDGPLDKKLIASMLNLSPSKIQFKRVVFDSPSLSLAPTPTPAPANTPVPTPVPNPIPIYSNELQKASHFFETNNMMFWFVLGSITIALAILVFISFSLFKISRRTSEIKNHSASLPPQQQQSSYPPPLSSGPYSNSHLSQDHPYTPKQLKALFSECYWTESDASAAALIRKFPDISTYLELDFASEYIHFLQTMGPGDLTFLEDAYFLNPYDEMFFLSPSDTPKTWRNYVSKLRFDKMNISVEESLTLIDERPIPLPKSRPRILKIKPRIVINSLAEEESLLNNLLEDQKLKLPSLYKLFILPHEKKREILSKYSAAELAEAWIAPQYILSDLEKLLPERKLYLMKALNKAPSRESFIFQKMIQECEKEWCG
ncbi:MAG: hypothetical protein HQK50_08775 [Oligoflexia bacterium]|nr:hypothetical protein [Oligoflexia bacterium]MBF0365652.1 hypothetical protein [Oligoflexia bacterium]